MSSSYNKNSFTIGFNELIYSLTLVAELTTITEIQSFSF